MKDILTQIVEKRRADIQKLGVDFGFTLPEVRKGKVHPFLQKKGVILEVKRASPSKGDIAPDLDAAKTAASYAQAGAGAISCLTESNYFKGNLGDLMNVCSAVDAFEQQTGIEAPAVLRKDFLLSEEEVTVAYRAGADVVLLIARILDSKTIVKMAKRAESYKMTCLIEVREESDLGKLEKVARAVNHSFIVCGVNSRDLATFKIDLLTPCKMLSKIRAILGDDARVIFESGIRSPQAASFAGSLGFTGLLLGEAAAKNPEARADLVKSFTGAQTTKNADFWNEYAKKLCSKEEGGKKRPFVKICGLTRAEDVLLADYLGADFTGFIFAAGFGRNVCDGRFEKIIPVLKDVKAKKIAVVTDPLSKEAEAACDYVEKGIIDCIQLHAVSYDSVPEKLLKLPHYFAVTDKSVPEGKTLSDVLNELFEKGEPRVLVDSKSQNFEKGTNLWLAGGLNCENARDFINQFNPELIDVSGGIEGSELGQKDKDKMTEFFNQINQR